MAAMGSTDMGSTTAFHVLPALRRTEHTIATNCRHGPNCCSAWHCALRTNESSVTVARRQLSYVPPWLLMPGDAQTRDVFAYQATMEPFMFDAIGSVLEAECRADQRAVFVDSGANEGLWTVLAAANGCRVLSIEPQPGCVAKIRTALALNPALTAAASTTEVWNHFLSPAPEGALAMRVSRTSCNGNEMFIGGRGSSSSGMSAAAGDSNGGGSGSLSSTSAHPSADEARVTARRLDASSTLFAQLEPHAAEAPSTAVPRVALWHLDVEGAEVLALRSASGLFERGHIDRVMLELKPEAWASFGLNHSDAFRELAHRFRGWSCHWACTGGAEAASFSWHKEAVRFAKAERAHRHPRFARSWTHGGPYCHAPWNEGAKSYDVFCRSPTCRTRVAGRMGGWRW